jgi:hypothetical protein
MKNVRTFAAIIIFSITVIACQKQTATAPVPTSPYARLFVWETIAADNIYGSLTTIGGIINNPDIVYGTAILFNKDNQFNLPAKQYKLNDTLFLFFQECSIGVDTSNITLSLKDNATGNTLYTKSIVQQQTGVNRTNTYTAMIGSSTSSVYIDRFLNGGKIVYGDTSFTRSKPALFELITMSNSNQSSWIINDYYLIPIVLNNIAIQGKTIDIDVSLVAPRGITDTKVVQKAITVN